MTTATTLERPLDALTRLTPLIREHADASEAEATLAPPVANAMVEAGLFRQLTPASLGGGEIDPVDWFRVVEAGARVDGSAGWCLFINGWSGTFGRTLGEAEAEKLFRDPRTVLAGAALPPGRATAEDGGYRVSGRWGFASGCKHATHLFALCIIFDGETPRTAGPMGAPELRFVVAPAADIQIMDTWNVVGLSGTGSHDIVFDDVIVPEEYSISLAGGVPNRHYAGPLYRLPFMVTFGWTISAVALGIAQHAIDIVSELAQHKVPAGLSTPLNERPLFHLQLADAIARVRSARSWLHESITELRGVAEAEEVADLHSRINCQLAASNATRSAREAVELMFLAAGGTAVYRKNELQRCMRDIHALSQHTLTNPATWEGAGYVLAGHPTQNPLLLL